MHSIELIVIHDRCQITYDNKGEENIMDFRMFLLLTVSHILNNPRNEQFSPKKEIFITEKMFFLL